MQLNSYEFITILLPLTLLAYFTVGRINVTWRKLVICASGVAVFAYAGLKGFLILIASIALNYILMQMMFEADWLRKPVMLMTVAMNVLVLVVFKYSNFAIINVNQFLGKNIQLLSLTLPLGISFFTFQQIAYAVNVYNGKIEKLNLFDYVSYILYFPKLIMGLIVDPVDLIGQMNDPSRGKWMWENFVCGVRLFSFGLFKKAVLADTFALAVSWGSGNLAVSSSLDILLVMLSYTFQFYFDFSGYSDMAIGVSHMMNIDLPQNFNSPYRALSVRDFWDRWHMSLTKFLTKYVYIPLGGSRKGKFRTYLNVVIVFTVSGIWHGANWTFILWGILYGLLSCADRLADPLWKKLWAPLRWIVTFVIINVLWLLFNASSISEWIYQLYKMTLGMDFTLTPSLTECFRGVEMTAFEGLFHLNGITAFTQGTVWMGLYLVIGMTVCLLPWNTNRIAKDNRVRYLLLSAIAFAWSFLFLGRESVFIYNNF